MTAVQVIQRLHQHRMWVTAQALACAETLDDGQLRRAFEIGQGSVWKTLTHLMAAEFVWLAALQGQETAVCPGDLPGQLPGNQLGPGAVTTLAELRTRWTDVDVRWNSSLSQLTEAALDETVYRVRAGSGTAVRFGTRRADVLLHVCTHAHYTTGQLVNMYRHLGVTPLPETMLIALARREASHLAERP